MTPKRIAITLAAAVVALLVLSPAAAGASKKNPLHPGVQTYTQGTGQCTANFLFKRGKALFLGQAAHCQGLGEPTDTNGCDSATKPLGTKVSFQREGSKLTGRIVYSSWIAMQKTEESNANACQYNDFALVKLKRGDHRKTSPNIPFFGGPTKLGKTSDASQPGDAVYSYGNSSARPAQDRQFRRKAGAVFEQSGGGWTRTIYTPNSPGIPGDSGSAVLDERGHAIATVSTLNVTPFPLSNGVSDLAKEVRYARSHGMEGLRLVEGTRKFDPQGLEVPGLPGGLGL